MEESSGLAPSGSVDKQMTAGDLTYIFVIFEELYILKTGELSSGNEVIVSKESHRFV